MALGRAFIEVHADLRPFKKDLGSGVDEMVRETQKAVKQAVDEGGKQAERQLDGSGMGRKWTRQAKVRVSLDTTDVDKESNGVGRKLRSAVTDGLKGAAQGMAGVIASPNTRNAIIGSLVAAAVVVAPVLAAIISGVIGGAIASAGIGAGIVLALRDARLKSAFADLGDNLMKGLENSARSFIRPLAASISILQAAFDRFFPRLEAGFAKLAPYVSELAYGIGGFLDAIGPGLEAAFSNSGPFIQIIADYLPVIGEALGYMFEQITASEGARAGLVLFFQMLGDIIVFVTDGLTLLADIFTGFLLWFNSLPDALVPDAWEADVDEMIASMLQVPGAAEQATTGILHIGGAAGTASQKAQDLTASLNTFFGAQLGWVDANINFEGSIDKVAAAFKGAKDNIDIGTQKGRENVGMVNDAIKSAIAMRDAKIKETGSVAAGNAVYSTSIERLRGVLRNAGLTKGEIEKLIGAYDEIPPGVSTEISVPGLATALSQAQRLNYELSRIQSDKLHARRNAGGTNGVGGYAEGGIVTKQELAWVGEGNRPEAIIPLTNPGRAAEIMGEAGLMGFGGGTITVQLILDGKVIDQRIVNANQATARSIQQQPRMI